MASTQGDQRKPHTNHVSYATPTPPPGGYIYAPRRDPLTGELIRDDTVHVYYRTDDRDTRDHSHIVPISPRERARAHARLMAARERARAAALPVLRLPDHANEAGEVREQERAHG